MQQLRKTKNRNSEKNITLFHFFEQTFSVFFRRQERFIWQTLKMPALIDEVMLELTTQLGQENFCEACLLARMHRLARTSLTEVKRGHVFGAFFLFFICTSIWPAYTFYFLFSKHQEHRI